MPVIKEMLRFVQPRKLNIHRDEFFSLGENESSDISNLFENL